MAQVRNILFIMCDQLRWDYLSCYGHPHLATPSIDGLAAKGVRYTRAYAPSPVCGPSRMSFYTGRTVFSHGATWNGVPLPVGELTLGDHLRPHGVRTAIVGKTHMVPDRAGMKRLDVASQSELGVLLSECGFEPYERDDGQHPDRSADPDLAYNAYLRALGYPGDNPWHTAANAAESADGEVLSGWLMRNAPLPARVAEEHSETPYMTDRAIAFMAEQGDRPWCLHLSYIKPHWPYIAPAPYHDMYGEADRLPVSRDAREREEPHPVYQAFMDMPVGRAFQRDEVLAAVVPVYMGLVKQIDDHLARLFRHLEDSGRVEDTLIVFTSDHGDYLGDHWLGEKELFHDESARIPLIVYDPDPAADATRGTVDDRLVEGIDLVPTFLDALGVELPAHLLEGRSLVPGLRRTEERPWRDDAFSELDYAFYAVRPRLGVGPNDARCYMIRTERWKYVHYLGFRPQLFDLENDPKEFADLGDDEGYAAVRAELRDRLLERLLRRRNRVAETDATVEKRTDGSTAAGILIGEW